MKRVALTMWVPVLPARAIPLLSLARATRRELIECLDERSPGWRQTRLRLARIRFSELPTRSSL